MRLSDIDRDNLSEAQESVLNAIEQGPRAKGRQGIGLIGPFGAFVRAPSVGGEIQALGAAIRFGTSLPENIKEVAICTVGAFFRSKFEFSAHKQLGKQAGIKESLLEQLQVGETPAFEGDELISYQVANQMLNQHGILDETYKLARNAFSETGLIELVATIGYYSLISLTLNSFQIPLEAGMEDPFPD